MLGATAACDAAALGSGDGCKSRVAVTGLVPARRALLARGDCLECSSGEHSVLRFLLTTRNTIGPSAGAVFEKETATNHNK